MSDDTTRMGMIDVTTMTMAALTVKTAISSSSDTLKSPFVSPMENMDLLRLVVSFLPKHYRFIAVISKSFHAAYIQEFPKDTGTILNAYNVEIAKICWEELKRPSTRQQYQLSRTAAFYGSLPAMQYLRSMRCYWDEWACAYAATNGHLHILQYSRENGCPWDEKTCANAADNGHLHVIQWARDNGCRWDEETCFYAVEHGHLHIIQYAREMVVRGMNGHVPKQQNMAI